MNFRLMSGAPLRPGNGRLQAWPYVSVYLMNLDERRFAGGITFTHGPHAMLKRNHAFRISKQSELRPTEPSLRDLP